MRQNVGLDRLLRDKNARITLLVPINSGAAPASGAWQCRVALPCPPPWLAGCSRRSVTSCRHLLSRADPFPSFIAPLPAALNAPIDARPLRNESTLAQLIVDAPELVNPLVGYHGESGKTGRNRE